MNKSKKIKAAVLLIVFSMNTLLGLACSIGFTFPGKKDKCYGEVEATLKSGMHDHGTLATHSHDEAIPTHTHATNVSAHWHEVVAEPHDHDNITLTEGAPEKATTDATKKDCKGDECCSDDVVKFSLIDKALTSVNVDGISLPQQLEFLLSAFVVSIHTQLSGLTKIKPPNLRSWPLASHTALRIVIQSFQI